MEKELQEIIRKNLPQEVGENLQKELAELGRLRARCETQETEILSLQETVGKLRGLKEKEQELQKMEIGLQEKARDLALREAVLEVKEKYAETNRCNNLEVVKAVFANNRYKYNEFGSQSVPSGQYGITSGPYNKSIDIEE